MAAGISDGVPGPPGGGGVAGGRVQVGALVLQPGGCLLGAWISAARSPAAGRLAASAIAAIQVGWDVLAGGQRGVQVVVQQPAGGGLAAAGSSAAASARACSRSRSCSR